MKLMKLGLVALCLGCSSVAMAAGDPAMCSINLQFGTTWEASANGDVVTVYTVDAKGNIVNANTPVILFARNDQSKTAIGTYNVTCDQSINHLAASVTWNQMGPPAAGNTAQDTPTPANIYYYQTDCSKTLTNASTLTIDSGDGNSDFLGVKLGGTGPSATGVFKCK